MVKSSTDDIICQSVDDTFFWWRHVPIVPKYGTTSSLGAKPEHLVPQCGWKRLPRTDLRRGHDQFISLLFNRQRRFREAPRIGMEAYPVGT
jgi:hypothetical protein